MKTNKLLLRSIGILMLVVTFMLFNNKAKATAAIYTWNGGSGSWASSNWTPSGSATGTYPGDGVDPSGDDNAIINSGTVTLSSNLSGNLDNLTINSGVLIISGTTTLTLVGTATVDGELSPVASAILAGAVTGTGQIDVTNVASSVDNLSTQYTGSLTLTSLTVDYEGTSPQQVNANTFDNLIVGSGAGGTSSNLTCNGAVTVNGNLTVSDNSQFHADGTDALVISGNFTSGNNDANSTADLYSYPTGYGGSSGSDITIGGNVSGTGTLYLFGATSGAVNAEACSIGGNMTIDGFSKDASTSNNPSTLVFNGTNGVQHIEPQNSISGSYYIDYLEINNPSGVDLDNTGGFIEIDWDLVGSDPLNVSSTNVRLYGYLELPGGYFVVGSGELLQLEGANANSNEHNDYGVQYITNAQTLYNLSVDNYNTFLGGALVIENNLNFVSDPIVIGYGGGGGDIVLQGNNLDISSGTITWAGSSTINATDGFIVTDNSSSGYLILTNTTGQTVYPIGDVSTYDNTGTKTGDPSYTPIKLTAATTSQVMDVRVKTGVTAADGSTPVSNVINKTWVVVPQTGSQSFAIQNTWEDGDSYDETGTVNHTATYVSYRLSESNPTPWIPNTSPGNTAQGSGAVSGDRDSISGGNLTMSHGNTYYIATGSDVTQLPVSLLTFGAQYQDGHVNLNWATASEQNNAYFEVERSTDAANWSGIGEVQGHGTSNVLNSYVDVDNLAGVVPTGTLYYRLKQVDFNGNYTYSMIRSVDLSNQAPSLAMYPNPTSNTLNVNWTSATEDNTVLRLINMSGANVYTQTVSGKGMIQRQIDMSLLPSGVYYLQVISSNGSTVNEPVYKN